MQPLSLHICQYMRRFFVKRPKFLAATSNLRVEQNLVHLGSFLHFSQKVVGVTLKKDSKPIVPLQETSQGMNQPSYLSQKHPV